MNTPITPTDSGDPSAQSAQAWLGRTLAWERRLTELRTAHTGRFSVTPLVQPTPMPARRVA